MPRHDTRVAPILGRSLATIGLCLALVGGPGAALARDESAAAPSPVAPSASTIPQSLASASPAALLSSTGAHLYPLPDSLVVIPADIPTVSIEAESKPGLVVGTTVPFTLPHCGLLSPVDVDGSLWRPVAGHDASGGPIDGDDDLAEFINATPGELTLISSDQAELVTVSGQVLAFERAPGALDYGLCM
jgi:hypothetical protein